MDGADYARQPCTRQEPPCLASRCGANGGPHKGPEGMRSARKTGQSNLSPNGPEPQIRLARTCSQRGHPNLKSTMSGQRDHSPTTFSAIATTAMTTGSAAQVPQGAVTPRPDPLNECPRKSAVGGQGPNLVGCSPSSSRQSGTPTWTRPVAARHGFLINSAEPWHGKFHLGWRMG